MAEPVTDSREVPPRNPAVHDRPTRVRHVILLMAVAVAVLLYLDRYCLSTADRNIKETLGLTEPQMALVLGVFFLPYALGQLPFGYLADRYGARRMLTLYMIAWSILTGLMGLATGFFDLVLYRLGCGLFESGAYPACAGMIKRWIPVSQRGLASGIVSLGGRIGGTVTPKLTTLLMAGSAVALPEMASWRPVLVFYGLFGLGLAALYWVLHRDSPQEHPACNDAERELIAGEKPGTFSPLLPARIPWGPLLRNRSLWLSSFVQFGINFGWAFLLTYLNRYLQEVHGADLQTRGSMSTLVVFMSLPALLVGGWLTDVLTRRHGKRWGRALPLAVPRFIAAGLYGVVALLTTYWIAPTGTESWTLVVLLGCVAFFSDLPLPSLWAVNLDMGGRNVGFVLGWGNMWGNLGAFLSPLILNQVVTNYGWVAVFWTCGAVFAVVGVACLFIDSREALPDT